MKLIKKIDDKIKSFAMRMQLVLVNKKAEGYVEFGLKILIAVVLGALLLAGLYTLFNKTVLPMLGERIKELFNYTGN